MCRLTTIQLLDNVEVNYSRTGCLCSVLNIEPLFLLSVIFSRISFMSPCQRQCQLLTSLGVRRPLTFHILIFSSESAYLNEPKHPQEVLYKYFSFRPDTLTNMAARYNSCFCLVNFYKSSLKLLDQMNRNLIGSIYGKSN